MYFGILFWYNKCLLLWFRQSELKDRRGETDSRKELIFLYKAMENLGTVTGSRAHPVPSGRASAKAGAKTCSLGGPETSGALGCSVSMGLAGEAGAQPGSLLWRTIDSLN